MKTIICGAGSVGTDIAEYLSSEDYEVTLIDTSMEVIDDINNKADIRALYGYGSYPDVLEDAGAKDADMVIAVTPSDELNMVTCLVAKFLFNTKTTIARIRAPEYLEGQWAKLYNKGNMPIDIIISPEREMAKSITRTLSVAGALEVIPLAAGKLYMLAMRCKEGSPLIHTPIDKIGAVVPDLTVNVVGIVRGGHHLIPEEGEQLLDKDEVYFFTPATDLAKAAAAFGYDEPDTGKVIIFGANRSSIFLAHELLNSPDRRYTVTLIEKDEALATKASETLTGANVIHGDFFSGEILEEAGIRKADTAIALTEFDEDNILASLLSKRYGVKRTMSLISKLTYNNLVTNLGIDVVIDPKAIAISSIIYNIRQSNVKSAYATEGGISEILEIDIAEHSKYAGKRLSKLELPKGVVLGAILHREKFLVPRPDLKLEVSDKLFFLTRHNAVKSLEKVFSEDLELF